MYNRPIAWFLSLFVAWWVLLAIFYAFPEIDIVVARSFFQEGQCIGVARVGQVCGQFPYSAQELLVALRKIFFYLPAMLALLILGLLIRNLQHHGATYSPQKTRDYSIALISFVIGPYLLVNLILKTISGRPRPYETDLFGGPDMFTAAGTLNGACLNNCSFISGEAAGAGWVACLILLLPKPLRPILGPPIIAICLVTPAIRVSFGGHYLSDVTLGFLSSAVIYAGVTVYFEMTQSQKKHSSGTSL